MTLQSKIWSGGGEQFPAFFVLGYGIEPSFLGYEPSVFPLDHPRIYDDGLVVGAEGFAPS